MNTTGNVFSAQEEVALDSMTTDYVFPGWVAFKIFGPMALEAFRLTLLETGDLSKEKTKAGSRTNTRKEAATVKNSERDSGRSGSPHKRGIRTRDSSKSGSPYKQGLQTGATKKDVASIALAADASDRQA
jgi:hypothetical protein